MPPPDEHIPNSRPGYQSLHNLIPQIPMPLYQKHCKPVLGVFRNICCVHATLLSRPVRIRDMQASSYWLPAQHTGLSWSQETQCSSSSPRWLLIFLSLLSLIFSDRLIVIHSFVFIFLRPINSFSRPSNNNSCQRFSSPQWMKRADILALQSTRRISRLLWQPRKKSGMQSMNQTMSCRSRESTGV